jgi:hypothetical protein
MGGATCICDKDRVATHGHLVQCPIVKAAYPNAMPDFEAETMRCVGCGCDMCADAPHASDCAVHNAPALPVGPCDCGAEG